MCIPGAPKVQNVPREGRGLLGACVCLTAEVGFLSLVFSTHKAALNLALHPVKKKDENK